MPRREKCALCEKSVPHRSRFLLINTEKHCMSCYSKKRRVEKLPENDHLRNANTNDNENDEPAAKKVKLTFQRYAFSHSR